MTMLSYNYKTPGVHIDDVIPPRPAEFATGVPVFLGLTAKGALNKAIELTLWPHFREYFGEALEGSYLADAVHGFFQNGGTRCYVLSLGNSVDSFILDSLQDGLNVLQDMDTVDLVCAPDIMLKSLAEVVLMQTEVLLHCEKMNDRFAILDSLSGLETEAIIGQKNGLVGRNGALYFPWIKAFAATQVQKGRALSGEIRYMPPCGHIAGIYAGTDLRVGPHKAPANAMLEGVVNLQVNISDSVHGSLNERGINCLRAMPGRGIRIWGARTLTSALNPDYVNVRRVIMTTSRWLERFMVSFTFEQNDFLLWMRIEREVSTYLNQLFRQGALKGVSQQQAFYIKCNEETNPQEVRDAGQVVTEIGIAPAVPSEFIVVRIVHGSGGVDITES